MSKQELVGEYLSGRMDRREFIKRLVSLGVSMVAAGTYAAVLADSAAASYIPTYGTYGGPTTKEQCKNGGYKAFGFKNQGQCVAFVQRGRR